VTRISEADVKERLRGIVDPCSESRGIGNDIVDMGLLDSVDVDGGHVTVRMRLTSPACHMVGYFSREVSDRVGSLDGVESVELETDSGLNWDQSKMTTAGRRRREEYLGQLGGESTD
jgi:metal-sulfur cluster biosynthetic enzyme